MNPQNKNQQRTNLFQWWFLLGNHNLQANPHVHLQHVVLATRFRSELPQPLTSQVWLDKGWGNPDRNVLAKTTCCWWTCGFAWWKDKPFAISPDFWSFTVDFSIGWEILPPGWLPRFFRRSDKREEWLIRKRFGKDECKSREILRSSDYTTHTMFNIPWWCTYQLQALGYPPGRPWRIWSARFTRGWGFEHEMGSGGRARWPSSVCTLICVCSPT